VSDADAQSLLFAPQAFRGKTVAEGQMVDAGALTVLVGAIF
jgi:hypothetical protein